MAGSPKFKVHAPDGEYVGSAKYAEDAAAFVALRGDGAHESYDYVADTIHRRLAVIHAEHNQKYGGPYGGK